MRRVSATAPGPAGAGTAPVAVALTLLAFTFIPLGDAAGKLLTEVHGLSPGLVAWSRFALGALIVLPFLRDRGAALLLLGDWRVWLREMGHTGEGMNITSSFNSYLLVIEQARRGGGIALGADFLIGNAVAAGELVPACSRALVSGRGYSLALPRHRLGSGLAQELALFLETAAAENSNPMGE